MVTKNFFYICSLFFSSISIPLSYLSVFEIRLLPVLIFLSFLCAVVGGIRISIRASIILYFSLLGYCLIFSYFFSTYTIFFSLTIFYWLAYWPYHIRELFLLEINIRNLISGFVLLGLFCSFGIFLQIVSYKFFGIQFGKIDFDGGGREAFGFLWTDYSFLSLFLTSLVPLVWYSKATYAVNLGLSLVLTAASILTSARTGVVALVGASAIFYFLEIGYLIYSGKMKKITLLLSSLAIIFFLPVTSALSEKFSRMISFDDSGRLDGYKSAYSFLESNYLMGAKFDILMYKDEVDVIPHNMFVYLLSVGGVVFLLLFLMWGGLVFSNIVMLKEKKILLSFTISLIGFQFIPSFFSAYYFAFFISICFLLLRQKSISKS
jgi:hypothetical protein